MIKTADLGPPPSKHEMGPLPTRTVIDTRVASIINKEAEVPLKTSRKEAALENVQHSCGAFLIGSALILSELLCHVLD